jgi:hypothetical protein
VTKKVDENKRRAGLIGGPARARALTPERRREIASKGGYAGKAARDARKLARERSAASAAKTTAEIERILATEDAAKRSAVA